MYQKRREVTGRDHLNQFLVWLAAIICTIIAIAAVVAGIVVFVGYLVIHPRVPVLSVTSAHLDLLRNDDLAGLLRTQLTINVRAQNGNAKAHTLFTDMSFNLSYQGQDIAVLVAQPFVVAKNSSRDLNYVVKSSSIPLTPDQMKEADESWKQNEIGFNFKGHARTQWRVGPLGSVKFWCHLHCMLRFHPLNGSYIRRRCSSKLH